MKNVSFTAIFYWYYFYFTRFYGKVNLRCNHL